MTGHTPTLHRLAEVLVLVVLIGYLLVQRMAAQREVSAAPRLSLAALEPVPPVADRPLSGMRNAILSRLGPQVLAIVAMLLVYLVFPASPLRPAVAIAFFSLCPGIALVTALRLDLATRLVLGVALSLALNMLVAEALLFSGHWSTELGLVIVAALTLGGAGLNLAQRTQRQARGE